MMVIYCFMACYYLFICTVLAQVSKVVEKEVILWQIKSLCQKLKEELLVL